MKHFLSVFLFFISSHAFAQNILQNIQTAAALDILAPFDFKNSSENKLDLRSAELVFFGPVDPTFDAYLNFAAHNEDGEFKAEVHEAYVGSSKLIPSSRFKVGKFFLGVGRLNQFHQHDWAFISAPRVQSDFFAAEGVADSGGEYSFLLPTDSYWDITVGLTNGYTFGETTDPAARPEVPTHYIHPVNFIDFGQVGALQWGFNYLGRTDSASLQTQLYGFDFVFKKTTGKTLSLLVQSEVWYQHQNGPTQKRTENLGAYIYPQVSLTEQLFLGLRVDLFKELNRISEADSSQQDNLNYTFVPTVTYKNSEFTLLRAAYTVDTKTFAGESDQVSQKIEFQWVAILGAHPAHSF